MTIQAIQTRYAGHHFRSRLEARWAVFFDYLGVEDGGTLLDAIDAARSARFEHGERP